MIMKPFLRVLLAAALLIALLPLTPARAGSIWDGGVTKPVGIGTPQSPYQIGTGRELKWFADQVNGGNAGIHAILTDDILLNDTDNWQSWATSPPANAWTPIGNETYRFRGVFDGKGYMISGVYINGADSYQGLFGYIGYNGTGTVKNVKLADSYVKGQSYVGGICGYMYYFSEISGCESGATVISAGSYAGGIASIVTKNSTIRNCRNTGSVTGGGLTGGITGNSNGTVTACINQGVVSGSGQAFGGLIGGNYGVLSGSYNTGSVSVSNGNLVGGILGTNGAEGTVTNAYHTGTVTGGWPVCGISWAGSSLTNVYFLGSPQNNGIGSNAGTGTAVNKSAAQFASGEVAYLLGAAFGQTLGPGGDPSPVFRTSDDSNAVYRLTYMNGAVEHAAQYYNAGAVVSSAGIAAPIMDNGNFSDWEGLPDIMPARDVTVTANSTPAPPQITTVSLPSGAVHKAYSARIEATGTAPITYSVIWGDLPPGLTLTGATGEITGTPTAEGSSTLTIQAQNSYGQDEKQFTIDISYEMSGSGTSGDPYQIWTASHLTQFAEKVNTTENKNFYAVLMADIALNDTGDWEDWETSPPVNTWTPIGLNLSKSFKGGFNGNNHTISGVYINGSNNSAGLFGHVNAAAVKDVNVVKSYLRGNEYVGGICGAMGLSCNIENCRSAATVSGEKYVGGVCGSVNASDSSIKNCQNDGMVTGTQRVGGIAGSNSGTVDLCRNNGTIQGGADGTLIGGICGSSEGTVKNAYNAGSSISGRNSIGGICGMAGTVSTKTSVIENVFNRGSINGSFNAAAICGTTNAYCSLTGCYYLNSSATSGIGYNANSYTAVSKSEQQFTSGEVAYLLGAAFGQMLGTDAYPVFRSSNGDNAVYKLVYLNETLQHAAQYYNEGNTVSAAGISSPRKDGHHFSHWENMPETMPAGDVTVSAVFLANNPPMAKSPVPVQSVTEGDTTGFNASDIAQDADSDTLTITAIVTNPDSGTAAASLSSGTVTITGLSAGGTSVVVRVSDGRDTVDVTVPVTVNPAPVPLSITRQPVGQAVAVGETASFTVEAAGDAPLSYQWKKDGSSLSDSGNISGATTATLTITNAQASNEGSYTCYVSNEAGNITSNAARLDITQSCLVTYRGAQLRTNADGTYDIRFLATIDTLDANSVGFVFSKSEQNPTKEIVPPAQVKSTRTVYNSVTAAGSTVTAKSLGGTYIIACTITKIPAGDSSTPLYTRAFVTRGTETCYTAVRAVTVDGLK